MLDKTFETLETFNNIKLNDEPVKEQNRSANGQENKKKAMFMKKTMQNTEPVIRTQKDHTTGLQKFLKANSDIPYLLACWIQLFLNLLFVVFIIGAIYRVYSSLHHDIQIKKEHQLRILRNEISICNRNYYENKCSPDTRAPALVKKCGEWEECMNKNPNVVWSAKLTATVLGELINEFFEQIKIRNFLLIMLFVTTIIVGSNVMLKLLRESVNHNLNTKPDN